MQVSIERALQIAVAAHEKGQLDKAAEIYRAILSKHIDHADANHNIGHIISHMGDYNLALVHYNRAREARPDVETFWVSSLQHCIRFGHLSDAREIGNAAIEYFPASANIEKILSSMELFKSESSPLADKSQIMKTVINLIHKKEFNAALKIIQNIDETLSHEKDIQNLHGIVHHKLKDFSLAENIFKNLIKSHPSYIPAYINFGTLLKDKGDFEESHKMFSHVKLMEPNNIENLINLGRLYIAKQDYKRAQSILNRVIKISPKASSAYFSLGLISLELGKHQIAQRSFHKALEFNPNDKHAWVNLGICYRHSGKIKKAINAFQKSLSIDKTFFTAQLNLANLYTDEGHRSDAVAIYQEAFKRDPKNVVVLRELGKLLIYNDPEKAIEILLKANELSPQDVDILNQLSNALAANSQHELALSMLEKALKIDSEHLVTLNNMSALYLEMNNLSKADIYTSKVLDLMPDHPLANMRAVQMNLTQHEKDSLQNLLKFTTDNNLPQNDIIRSHFAIANHYERAREYQSAFHHYCVGNRLKLRKLKYDIDRDKKIFAEIRGLQKDLQALPNLNEIMSMNHLFVVGMPRSGTTLVEQIISAHSAVHGCGELSNFANYWSEICSNQASEELIAKFRSEYVEKLSRLNPEASCFVDKMPHNFKYIGLIKKVLPNAKFVHMQRDPGATCWSNFTQLFNSANGLGYSYDLKSTSKYFLMYRDLMDFWGVYYKPDILHFNYEKLVLEPEANIRSLISFCDLDWQDQCLEPHKNKRVVKTASHLQVRKEIYQGSSQQWHNYKRFIGNVFDELY